MPDHLNSLSSYILLAHIVIVTGFSIRIVTRRRAIGVSLAWLILIFALPFLGAMLYILIGEHHLGKRRAQRTAGFLARYEKQLQALERYTSTDLENVSLQYRTLNRLARATIGIPALAGNEVQLFNEAPATFQSIIADINRARYTCYMVFYIWAEGGTANQVCDALIRAAKRGVACKVLVDAVGSSAFLKSGSALRLKQSGVELVAALPVGPIRMIFVRLDLRLHRKIVVIDEQVAYTGSMNLVDPRYFKQEAGVGRWVDAMARIEGPAVHVLSAVFLLDWQAETGQENEAVKDANLFKAGVKGGSADIQVFPSGPGYKEDAIHRLLLMAIYAARSELVMTTPYFVPDESLITALQSAAYRGVHVTIILPERIDSKLVRYACRSYFDELLHSGVQILRFQGGLLHTKSITVDGEIALFGTVNLDMRSFWLDFEVTLLIYSSDFTKQLRKLQRLYAEESEPVNPQIWGRRPAWERFIENIAQLFGPLI